MRPIWKGSISFGLVNVPVTLYPAEERTDLRFHMLDSRDNSRVRYERVNSETGEEVPWNQIVKGYEFSEGNYVIIEEAELKKAAPKATKTVEIESFVDLADIDPLYFDRPYYLEPAKGGEKGYVLLRETLRQTGKAGIAKVVIRLRQYMAAMIPRGDALVLELLRYHQEVRPAEDLDLPGKAASVGISAQEVKMATMLVEGMTGEWNPSSFQDEYRENLTKWIKQKAKTGETPAPFEDDDDEPPAPINLMEALKKSLGQGGGGSPGGGARPRTKTSASSRTPGRSARKRASTAARSPSPAAKASAKRTTRKKSAKATPRKTLRKAG